MQADKEMLQKLQSMDDDSLIRAINELSRVVGADKKQTERALKNVKFIKKRLAAADEATLKRAADKLGEEKTEQIIRSLKL